MIRVAELFAGYGGLGMGVAAAIPGTELVSIGAARAARSAPASDAGGEPTTHSKTI